jgi:uncharacterized protein (TIGR02246 family)
MRRMILCLTLGITCLAFAQLPTVSGDSFQGVPSKNTGPSTSLADLLEAKVRAAWAAFKMRDKDRYADFLTDDFQAVEADGDGERPKMRILREVEHSMYTDYLLQLFQVQQLGQNHAFVTYEATMQFPAGSAVRYKRVFAGELWTERNGQWKMMRYQETPVR